ncbi:hypothetical protein ACQ4PT_042782 [Festuca glaucescens]
MVVNPSTREKLRVPPLPCAGSRRGVGWDKAYSFGYHPFTGRYKVVHVPCSLDRACEFDVLQVLTLGEAAWREVPLLNLGGAKCNLNAGIVSVDGATYWVAGDDSARIMSFDLQDERIVSATWLPTVPAGRDQYHLTEAHGRLGVVAWDASMTAEVWVLEKEQWSRWYSLRGQDLPRPHIVYDNYVLTRKSLSFYGHWFWRSSGGRSVVRVRQGENGRLVAKMIGEHYCYRTFAYVKTTEPLGAFKRKQLGVDMDSINDF